MNITTLEQVVAESITGTDFRLDFTRLQNQTLAKSAAAVFPQAILQLTGATSQRLPAGTGFSITGSGRNAPFITTQVTLTLKVEGGACIASISARAAKEWAFPSLHPSLARESLFKISPALLERTEVKTDFHQTAEEGTLLAVETVLNAEKVAPELASILGLQKMTLSGSLGLSDGGASIRKLELGIRLDKEFSLGNFKIKSPGAAIAALFMNNGANAPAAFIRMYFVLRGVIEIQIRNKAVAVPVEGAIFGWGESLTLRALPEQLGELALEALAQLGDSEGISDFLPAGFSIAQEIRLKEVALSFALRPALRFKRAGISIRQANRWNCYTFPSGKQIAIENVEIDYAIVHNAAKPSSFLQLKGQISWPDNAKLLLSADTASECIFIMLDHDHPLKLGKIAEEWLQDYRIDWLPGMKNFEISELDAMFSYAGRGFNVSLSFGDSEEQLLVGKSLDVRGFIHLNYDPEAERKFEVECGGTVRFGSVVFALSVEYSDKTTFTMAASNLRLSEIIREWTGQELPDGMPDLVSDELSLTIASDRSFSVSGDFRVEGKPLNLAGKEINLLAVEFSLAYTPEKLDVKIKVSGEPAWEFTPGLTLNSYALEFALDKDKTTGTAWKLGGHLDVTFFGKRNIRLGGEWTSDKNSKTLQLKAGTQQLHDRIDSNAFISIDGIDEAGSLAIYKALQAAKMLDEKGEVTKEFAPWRTEFSFTPPEAHKEQLDEILDVVAGKNHFLSVEHEGNKLFTYDPHEIELSWESRNGSATWSLDTASSMQFYIPLDEEPVFRLRYGRFKFLRNASTQELSFSFKAKEASLKLFEFPYEDATAVKEPGGQIEAEKKIFATTFNLGEFSFTRKNNTWQLVCDSDFRFSGMPSVLSKVLENKVSLGVRLKKNGMEFFAKDGLKTLEIPDFIRGIGTEAGIQLPELGTSAIRLKEIAFKIGKELTIKAEAGFGLPEKLNEALGFPKKVFRTWIPGKKDSLITASISLGTAGITGTLDSPFAEIEGIEVKDDDITIDLDVLTGVEGCGMFKLKKPGLAFDFKKGTFKISGGYSIDKERGLSLPLNPLKAFMKMIQLPEAANALPPKVSLTEVSLQPKDLRKLLSDSKLPIPKELLDVLDLVQDEIVKKLPGRLHKYLGIKLPTGIDFELNITPDGGVSFSMETQDVPIQFLLPTATALAGYQISRIDFGTAFGGSMFKLELSARADAFDYLSLAACLLLYDIPELKPWLTPREIVGCTFEVKDLVILIVYPSGIPIPIPVFCTKFEMTSAGPEGLMMHGCISFPKPTLNLMKVLKIVAELKNLFTSGKDLTVNPRVIKFALDENYKEGAAEETAMNLIFNAGPMFIRLPRWIADESDPKEGTRGFTIGATGKYQLLNVLNFAAILLNSVHHLFKKDPDSAYFIKSFDVQHRMGAMKAKLLNTLEAETVWIAATPREFATDGWKLLSAELSETYARSLLTVIPVDDKFVLDAGDDKSALIFLHGKLKIADALEASATGGLLLSANRLGAGLRLAGHAGNVFTWLLQGSAKIEKQGFVLKGNVEFALLQFNLFSSKYVLTNDQLLIEMELGDERLPVGMSGKIEGQFRTGLFHLEGSGKLRFFGLIASVSHKYHFDDKKNALIEHKGSLAIGALAGFAFDLVAKTGQAGFALSAHLRGDILSVLNFDFLGTLSGSPAEGLKVSGTQIIRLLGKELLNIDATWERNELRFNGDLNLFPGLESVIVLKSNIHGTIGKELFELTGGGQFRLGAVDLELSTDWRWTPQGFKLLNNIKGILGADVQLALTGGNGAARLAGRLNGAVKLFNDLLLISSTTSSSDGPQMEIGIKNGVLDELYFDGAFTLLGISAGARLSWKNQQLLLLITHKFAAGSVFKSDYTLTATYSPTRLHVGSDLQLELDLKPVFDFLGRGKGKNTKVTFHVKNFNLNVERTGPPDPKDDPALKERIRAINAELEALKRLLADTDRKVTAVIDKINDYIRHAEKEKARFHSGQPEHALWWKYWSEKEHAAQELRRDVMHHNKLYSDAGDTISRALTQLKTVDPVLIEKTTQRREFEKYFEHMWYASRCWKHPSSKGPGDHRQWWEFRDVYINTLRPDMFKIITGFGTDFTSLFNNEHPYNSTHSLFHYIDTKIMGGWHDVFGWHGKQQEALTAKQRTISALDALVSIQAAQKAALENTKKSGEAIQETSGPALQQSMRNAEGFLLVSALEEKNNTESDLLKFNIANNGMNKTPAPAASGLLADTSNTWNVRFDADITFTLPGLDKTFSLVNIKWQTAHGINLNRPMAEWLADVIIEFLKDNFMQVLGQQLHNIIEIAGYIARQLLSPGGMGDQRNPTAVMLESMAGLDAPSVSVEEYLKKV